jgi:hypothetical protein
MLRVSIIGPGNVKYHYQDMLKLPKGKFSKELKDIAKALVKANSEIVVLPDDGAPFELACLYKKFGGQKAFASIPKDDKDLGIEHLKPYAEYKINGKRLFDEVINTKDWYGETFYLAMLGDVVLMLGFSLGSMGELSLSYYMHKVFIGDKVMKGVKDKRVPPQIRGGKSVPFSVIIYKPFIKHRLNKEMELYIRRHKGRIYYAENGNDIFNVLKQLESIKSG